MSLHLTESKAHKHASKLLLDTQGKSSGWKKLDFKVRRRFLFLWEVYIRDNGTLAASKGETVSAQLDDGRTATVSVDKDGRGASIDIE